MIKLLQQKFEATGYRVMESNIPGLNVYYQSSGDILTTVLLIDNIPANQLSQERFNAFKEKIQESLNQKGNTNMDLLTLIATDDIQGYRSIISHDTSHWLIDIIHGRLYVYEDQPADYHGLYAVITKLLEQSDIDHPLSREKTAFQEFGTFIKSRSVINLCIVLFNILIFIILERSGSAKPGGQNYILSHGAAYAPLIIEDGQFYRLFTCMFIHFNISHLFNNMLVLFALGDLLEKEVGKVRYIIIYILGGLGGSLASLVFESLAAESSISAGASGCIFAVIGALLYIVLVNKGQLESITTRGLAIMIFITLYHGFTSAGIDNMAHIGGLVLGFLLALIVYRKKPRLPLRPYG